MNALNREMHLSQLRDFAEIARAGSFRKAALRLHKSQPALTRSITLLEEELGLALFQRATTGVTLTPEGARILIRAGVVLAESRRLADEAAQIRGLQQGTVRIGVSPVGGTLMLPRVLPRFRRDWPGIDLEIQNVLYPEALNLLRDGRLDLVIGPLPRLPGEASLEARRLLDMRIVVVAHAHSPFADATRLSQTAAANWLVHGPAEGPGALFADLPTEAGAFRPVSLTRCHSLSTLLEVLSTGDGLAFLSDRLFARFGAQYGLRCLPIEDALPEINLSLIQRRDVPLTPAGERLAQLILRLAASDGADAAR
jgi:DNA-binding transcriptional LysR family regulator